MLQLLNLALTNQLNLNQIACLYYLKNKIAIPEIYNPRINLAKLALHGYIDSKLSVTDPGKRVLKSFEDLFETQRKKAITEVLGDAYKEQIEVFRTIYPRKNSRGRLLTTGCSNENLAKSFEWFFKNYPDFTWDTVFRATRAYVDNVDKTYIKDMKYFIKKQDTQDKTWDSTLAAWCFDINKEDDDNERYDLDKDVKLL